MILLSLDINQVERSCALAHELMHDDIRIVSPPAPELIMDRVEDIVDRRNAKWPGPPDDLKAWVWRRVEIEPVTAELVAEEGEVTIEVAARALALLAQRG